MESSKGFCKGNRLSLSEVAGSWNSIIPDPQTNNQIHEKLWTSLKIYRIIQSMKICENLRNSRQIQEKPEAKKPAWNRARASIGAAGRLPGVLPGLEKSIKINRNSWNSLRIHRTIHDPILLPISPPSQVLLQQTWQAQQLSDPASQLASRAVSQLAAKEPAKEPVSEHPRS